MQPTSTSRILTKLFEVDLERVKTPPEPADLDIFTDGSKGNGDALRVGHGAQFYENGQKTTFFTFRLPSYCTVYQAEMDAIRQAGKFLLDSCVQNRSIRLFSDSLSSLMTLNGTKFRSLLSSDTVRIWNQVGACNSVTLCWVKAHVGIPGNERADFLAKAGSELDLVTMHLPPPPKALRQQSHAVVILAWDEEWLTRKDCEQSRFWFPHVVANTFGNLGLLSLSRQDLSLVAQFITGFNNLGRHTVNKKEITSGPCRLCGAVSEFAWHLATQCPASDALRHMAFHGSGPENANWKAPMILEFIHLPLIHPLMTTRHTGPPPV
jgi:ribonuclease HI